MTERVSVDSKIIEINQEETNDIFMTMHLRILSNEINLNKALFTSDFIDGVVADKEKYVGIPFLVNRKALENDEYLTHELDMTTGELGTDQIGSFTDYWKETGSNGEEILMGSVKIFKRFKATCDKIVDLASKDELATSCEVAVQAYQEISDEGVRTIHYNEGENFFIGSAIVTDPAYKNSKPTLLIAEAYKKDIASDQNGGENLPKENKSYNNGIEVEYRETGIESASLRFYEIEQQIYAVLNPYDAKKDYREYNYYIHTLFNDKVIVEDDRGDLYSAPYNIEEDTVILSPEDKWQKGSYQFVPESVDVNELIKNNNEIQDLNSEIEKLKEEKNNMSKEKVLTAEETQELEQRITDLEQQVADLEAENAELKAANEELEAKIVEQKEGSVETESVIADLKKEVEALTPYKEQVEKAELEAKQKELSDKFRKVLSEETFATEEVAKAIAELDEAKLNSIVVSELATKAEQEVETASVEKDIVVKATSQGALVTPNKDKNYWTSTK